MITKELKGTKAITLIAMVISILVLLILAGVSLSLVVGETGITQRAVTAKKTYDIAGAKEKLELQIAGYAGDFYQDKYINGNIGDSQTVGDYVLGKFTNGSDFEGDYTLTKDGNEITITNKKDASQSATATIDENGKVSWSGTATETNRLSISSTMEIMEGKIAALTVAKIGTATSKEVSWSKTGNITFVTSLTDDTEVASPTEDTVYIKAGAFSSGTVGTVTVSATGEEDATSNITIKEFVLGEPAENSAVNYGKKVIDYKSNSESTQDEIGWRVFYQDTEGNTYLIADKLVGSYTPGSSWGSHTGANTSAEGKGLNLLVKNLMTTYSSNSNMKATSWFTDPAEWSTYTDSNTNNKVTFAIASPTIELYTKSYNAVAAINDLVDSIEYLTVGTYGYATLPSGLTTRVNGIYNKGSGTYWWLASPYDCDYGMGFFVDGDDSIVGINHMSYTTFAVRPIVCIPTSEIGSTYHLEN